MEAIPSISWNVILAPCTQGEIYDAVKDMYILRELIVYMTTLLDVLNVKKVPTLSKIHTRL